MVRTRFAPSPTGDLHLGGAWTALASWALAKASGGATVLRIEDIDTPRIVPGAAARIMRDLEWLGLTWDESPDNGGPHAPYTQSDPQALARYCAILNDLDSQGLTYPCDCSRAEIAREASAPHEGEEIRYPGTCRNAPRGRTMKRPPAIRLRVPDSSEITFDDLIRGRITQRVDRSVGDFVLRRGDGLIAYQLAVAIDDAAMGVSHVVRADDLALSTPRQILLMHLAGFSKSAIPSYAHVPMVLASNGERLAKRSQAATIHSLRDAGLHAEHIIGALAHGLGLVPASAPRCLSAREVAAQLQPPERWRSHAWHSTLEVPAANA